MKKPLIILTGPTSVGKTEISIKLAKALNGEIISADSMQVYKYMNIGSAKITREEMQGVPHHLIDILEPTESFDIVQFKTRATAAIDDILSRGKMPIIVGGTGFYIQSVLYDINFETTDSKYREELEQLLSVKGEAYLYDMLKELDPKSAEIIHMHNHKRVIRALEFYHETGKKISDHNESEHEKESPYSFVYFVLNTDRDILYDRINRRVDMMIEAGLLDEVRGLMDMGCTKDMISMKGLGYKEIIDYYLGNLTLDEAIDTVKKETRHFAKKQLTWFRREREVTWINKADFQNDEGKILDYMVSCVNESCR